MNKLIPGALFSVRSAGEQRLRLRIQGLSDGQPTDVTDHSRSWNRAAECFRRRRESDGGASERKALRSVLVGHS